MKETRVFFFVVISLAFFALASAATCGNNIVEPPEQCDNTTAGSCCLNNCTFATASNIYNPSPVDLTVPVSINNGFLGISQTQLTVTLSNYPTTYTVVSAVPGPTSYAPFTPPVWSYNSGSSRILFTEGFAGTYIVTLASTYCTATNSSLYFTREVTSAAPTTCTSGGTLGAAQATCATAQTSPASSTTKCDCSVQGCVRMLSGSSSFGCQKAYPNCTYVCADVLSPKPVNATITSALVLSCGNTQRCSSPYTSNLTCTCPSICGDGIIDKNEACDPPTCGSCCTNDCTNTTTPTTTIPSYAAVTAPCSTTISIASLGVTGTSNFPMCLTFVNSTGPSVIAVTGDSTNIYINQTFNGVITVLLKAVFCTKTNSVLYFTRVVTVGCCGNGVLEYGEECDAGSAVGACCLTNCTIQTATNTYNPSPYYLEVVNPAFPDATRTLSDTVLGFNRSATNYNYAYQIINWTKTQYTFDPTYNATQFAWPSTNLFYSSAFVGSYDVYMKTTSCNLTGASDYFVRRITLPSYSCDLPLSQTQYGIGVCTSSATLGTASNFYPNQIATHCDCSLHQCYTTYISPFSHTVMPLYGGGVTICDVACDDILVPKPVSFNMITTLNQASSTPTCTSSGTTACSCTAVCGDGVVDTGEYCDMGTSMNAAVGGCCTDDCQAPTSTAPLVYTYTPPTGGCNSAGSKTISLSSALNLPTTSNSNFNPSWSIVNVSDPGLSGSIISGGNLVLPVLISGSFTFVFSTPFCTATNTLYYYTRTITANCCGDSNVQYGEDCDPIGTQSANPCCNKTLCKFTPANVTVCRASASVCDAPEYCSGTSGTCPANGVYGTTVLCRNVTGVCDVAEYCDGVNPTCPANVFAPSSTVCRPAVSTCDATETCTGGSDSCPADAYASSSTVCRASAGPCDLQETCTGTSTVCPSDVFANSTVVCNPSSGACDPPEYCTFGNASCPANVFSPSSTVCRAAVSVCDVAESCTGVNATCPPDLFQPSTYVCRPNVSNCDVSEYCNGITTVCPSNVFASSSTVCRPVAGPCDVQETCTGTSSVCPTDLFATSSTVCNASTGVCDPAEYCIYNNASCPANVFSDTSVPCRTAVSTCDVTDYCPGNSASCSADAYASSSTVCRPAADVCDVPESCTGTSTTCPADTFKLNTVLCRNSTGACDTPSYCTGSTASCPADYVQPQGTTCRAAVSTCDVAEVCDGVSGACPADAYASSSTVCRASGGVCDPQETCTGTSTDCPVNVFYDNTVVCNASLGACDPPEYCTGSSATCPTNVFTVSGVVCNASTGVCQNNALCDGITPTCPSLTYKTSASTCRSAAGTCDIAEVCSGSSADCPPDVIKTTGTICSASLGPCMPNSTCDGVSTSCTVLPYYNTSVICRPSTGGCDIADYCPGNTYSCTTDAIRPSGYVCLVASAQCQFNTTCSGSDTSCSTVYASPGASCHYDTNYCYNDVCSTAGSTVVCTRGAAINYDDGLYCNGLETCNPVTGLKVSGTAPNCNNGNSCDTDTCSNSLSSCVYTPVANSVGPCGGGLGACTPGNYTCDGSGPTPIITCVGAVQPTQEICFDGIDNNCNGQVDEFCTGAPCTVVEDCYTELNITQCVEVSCDLGECNVTDLPSTTRCDDGLRCTFDDYCDGLGQCVGQPVICDDFNECTADSCSEDYGQCVFDGSARSGLSCTSTNLCATSSQCDGNGLCAVTSSVSCSSSGAQCAENACNASTGACQEINLLSVPCDDGNACTNNDVCTTVGCVGTPIICNDYIACTIDTCSPEGVCVHTVDANHCLIDGQCVANGTVNPASPCLACHAQENSLAWHQEVGSCNDNDLCTIDDTCMNGVCLGTPMDCSSLDSQCSEGVCQHGHCVASPIDVGIACNDGLYCTTDDQCTMLGACEGMAVPCNQFTTQCSISVCDEDAHGCISTQVDNYTRCALDNDVCNGYEYCLGGMCIHGDELDCSTTNECLGVSCDPLLGCTYTANTNQACDDGNACTINDECGPDGICYPTTLRDCDDGDACTDDFCDAVLGCTHVTLDNCTVCSIDEDCSLSTCRSVACVGGSCQYSAYLPGTTCGQVGDCNADRYCINSGTCTTLVTEGCNDTNTCTADSCEMGIGCLFTPTAGSMCDDGDLCTVDDVCDGDGGCSGTPYACPESTDCLAYTCQVIDGEPQCVAVPKNIGGSCVDDTGNLCNVAGVCSSYGVCNTQTTGCPTPPECVLYYFCYALDGQCHPFYADEGAPCNTENLCTPYYCDGAGSCVPDSEASVVCPFNATESPCQSTPTCIPSTGECTPTYLDNGVACNDNDPCTFYDACLYGHCQGELLGNCSLEDPHDPCKDYPVCNAATGECVSPSLPDYYPCDKNDPCVLVSACIAGVCTDIAFANCDDGNDCTFDYCDSEGCHNDNTEGNACELDACSVASTCYGGACTRGDYIDCSSMANCSMTYCSPTAGCLVSDDDYCHACALSSDCPQVPCRAATCSLDGYCTYTADDEAIDGCSDDVYCNGEEVCAYGSCVLGTPVSCPYVDECSIPTCNEEEQVCVYIPTSEGVDCTDSVTSLCTLAAECDGFGTCTETLTRSCDDSNPCRSLIGCDSASGACVYAPKADGTPCTNGDLCAVAAQCHSEICVTVESTNCSLPGDWCAPALVCNSLTGACETSIVYALTCDDNSACSLGDHCNVDSICTPGNYTACDFIVHDEQCQVGMCVGDTSACTVNNLPDTTPCSTGAPQGPCSGNDACFSGACVRSYSTGTVCRTADASGCDVADVCVNGQDQCPPNIKATDGTLCVSGLFCAATSTCKDGTCIQNQTTDCSEYDSPCTVGQCDEESRQCVAVSLPDKLACIGMTDQCLAHSGCSYGYCQPFYETITTPCNDGDNCTTDEHCSGVDDTCFDGITPDCTFMDGQCSEGVCNPDDGECEVQYINDDLPCNADSDLCTVNDTCHSGTCVQGTYMNCTYLSNECRYGVCAEGGVCDVHIINRACSADYCSNNCTAPFEWWSSHRLASFAWPQDLNSEEVCGRSYEDWSQIAYEEHAWLALFQQWLGATLNIANGACAPNSTLTTLQNTSPLINACDTTLMFTNATAEVYRVLLSELYAFNTGIIGPGLCDPTPCFNNPSATSTCLLNGKRLD